MFGISNNTDIYGSPRVSMGIAPSSGNGYNDFLRQEKHLPGTYRGIVGAPSYDGGNFGATPGIGGSFRTAQPIGTPKMQYPAQVGNVSSMGSAHGNVGIPQQGMGMGNVTPMMSMNPSQLQQLLAMFSDPNGIHLMGR